MMKLELLSSNAKGKRKPQALLFLHGICVGAWIWEKHFLPYFSKAGYDCYALSLRGHGGSEGHENLHHYRLADYTDDLQRTVAGIQRPLVVIGHSLGGAVLQDWLRLGGKAQGAALLASVPPWGLAPSAMRMAWHTPALYRELAKLNMMGMHAADKDVLCRGLFSETTSVTEIQEFIARSHDESPHVGMELQGMRPFAPLPWAAPPMFVLGGENDQLIAPDEVRRTATYYGTHAVMIPHLPHAVMVDQHWQSAADALLVWLNQLVPTR